MVHRVSAALHGVQAAARVLAMEAARLICGIHDFVSGYDRDRHRELTVAILSGKGVRDHQNRLR